MIAPDALLNPEFENYLKTMIAEEPDICKPPGDQHFRLLTYMSTLVNHSVIVDIGTNKGHGAYALAYNPTNTVYTFDTDKKIDATVAKKGNIQPIIGSLLSEDFREQWKNTILSSAFIFMDIEPHDGIVEHEIVQYLKSIDYKGVIVCDDIWFFKGMRDNLWYKIEEQYKYDFSDIGHWSGTGLISFHPDAVKSLFPSYEKRDNSNWTLVTAYFNLTKCADASVEIKKRDQTHYMTHSISTLSLPYNMVIYCDQDSLQKIQEIRPEYLKSKTHYCILEFEEFQFVKNGGKLHEKFSDYRQKIIENRKNHPYYFDNRNTASYYLFCMSRYIMLKDAITQNVFGSTHFCWINICIERMGFRNVMRLDEALAVKRDKFSTCYIDYIPESLVMNTPEYFQWGRCGMCSGFFTGNAKYMYDVCDLIENKFLEYVESGYGHADEQLYSPVYFQNPDMFEHYYGDYTEMITNYKYVYDRPEPPIHNFIKNSFAYGNYAKCHDACKFVVNSWILGKCNISPDYLSSLFSYYMNCKKHLKAVM